MYPNISYSNYLVYKHKAQSKDPVSIVAQNVYKCYKQDQRKSYLPYSLQSILLQGCSTIPDRTQVRGQFSFQHVLFINIRCTCRFSQSQDDTFLTPGHSLCNSNNLQFYYINVWQQNTQVWSSGQRDTFQPKIM